jgi:hypothetical protein
MVDWWQNNERAFIVEFDVNHLMDAPNLIKAVIQFTDHTDDSRHDVAMCKFACFDNDAAAAAADIDRRRRTRLRTLFAAGGFEEAEALPAHAGRRTFTRWASTRPRSTSLTNSAASRPSATSDFSSEIRRWPRRRTPEHHTLTQGDAPNDTLAYGRLQCPPTPNVRQPPPE